MSRTQINFRIDEVLLGKIKEAAEKEAIPYTVWIVRQCQIALNTGIPQSEQSSNTSSITSSDELNDLIDDAIKKHKVSSRLDEIEVRVKELGSSIKGLSVYGGSCAITPTKKEIIDLIGDAIKKHKVSSELSSNTSSDNPLTLEIKALKGKVAKLEEKLDALKKQPKKNGDHHNGTAQYITGEQATLDLTGTSPTPAETKFPYYPYSQSDIETMAAAPNENQPSRDELEAPSITKNDDSLIEEEKEAVGAIPGEGLTTEQLIVLMAEKTGLSEKTCKDYMIRYRAELADGNTRIVSPKGRDFLSQWDPRKGRWYPKSA